jgi:hypothetical protein
MKLLIAALAAVLLVAACGDDDAGLTTCEQAWEQGLGNAQQPGIDRDEWIAGCRSEGGDELELGG